MVLHKFKRKNKFNAIKKTIDGMIFDSKIESEYYIFLKMCVKAGDVSFFIRQTPFHIPGNVTYRCDFSVFWTNGTVSFIDVKGFETEKFKAIKKIVETLYPIEIEIVKKTPRFIRNNNK